MNGLRNLDETYSDYSLARADDLIRLCRSKVKVTEGPRGGEGIHVDIGSSKSIFWLRRTSEQPDRHTDTLMAILRTPTVYS